MIETVNLTLSYGNDPVVSQVSVQIQSGRITGILGPNGAGKSTLMKGMLNLLKPQEGKILYNGQPFNQVRKQIAYVPQISAVNWDFPTTVFDVVLMGRYVHCGWIKRPNKKDKLIAQEAIKKVQLEEFANRQINQLSGGQKRRVFLARALCQQADLYMLDEPFAGVDMVSEQLMIETFKNLKENHKTIVIVHHDLNTVVDYFDDVILINNRLVDYGPVDKVFNQSNLTATYRYVMSV